MEDLFARILKKAPEETSVKSPARAKNKKNGGWNRSHFIIGSLCISAALLCLSVYLLLDTFTLGAEAAMDAFTDSKDTAEDEVYQFFYDLGYENAEESHHVSNDVSITIGDLSQEQKLEVLKVSEVDYQVQDPDDKSFMDSLKENISNLFFKEVVSWLEVPGHGVFTVNLKAGEFVIDKERQRVLIRVPGPELTEFTIDYEHVEVLYFEKGGAFRDSANYGIDKAREQLENAELTMMQKVKNNQDFYKRAKASTQKILGNLVEQLNPHLPNLIVEVEFID